MADTRTPPFLAKLCHDAVAAETALRLPIYVPPLNFAAVTPHIYRSGFPRPENYPFLDSLELKTILYLSDTDFRDDTFQWATKRGLRILHYRVEPNKEPLVECNRVAIAEALAETLDTANWPVLVHCNRGRHRVGLLCALVRRVQKWSFTMIFEEYRLFFGHGNGEGKTVARVGDYEWIESFDMSKYDPQGSAVTLPEV